LDEVIKKIVILNLILLVFLISGLIGNSEKIWAQSINVWYGNVDESPISGNIDDTVKIDVYVQTDPDAYAGSVLFCLGANEQYIDTMLSGVMDDSLVIFYPFSEWEIAAYLQTSYSPPNEPGWFCQPFFGIARLFQGNGPWLHNEIPLKVLSFVAKTVNDPALIGLTVEAFGPGEDQAQGASNSSDSAGMVVFTVVESFSYLSLGGQGAIEGSVTDSTGQPIENVTVEVADTAISSTTNSMGYYLLSGLIPGTYSLVFSHPDYIDTSISDVPVTANDTTIQDVILYMDKGSIAGNVFDVTEDGIRGVEITVINAGISDTTDINGDYVLENISAGLYSVSFSHPDYKDTIINGIQVVPEDTTSLDIVMFFINSGFIAGSVIDTMGISVEDVEVTVVNTIITDTTDFYGNYLLMNVPLGVQNVSFAHPAYRDTVITGIVVVVNDTAFADTLVFLEGADGPLPDKLGLLTNYPNPFTASTTIRFYMAAPDQVEVKIYDLLGRKVKSFTTIQGKVGFNLVQWFASDYAAGIYIVKVNSGDASKTKSIIKF